MNAHASDSVVTDLRRPMLIALCGIVIDASWPGLVLGENTADVSVNGTRINALAMWVLSFELVFCFNTFIQF